MNHPFQPLGHFNQKRCGNCVERPNEITDNSKCNGFLLEIIWCGRETNMCWLHTTCRILRVQAAIIVDPSINRWMDVICVSVCPDQNQEIENALNMRTCATVLLVRNCRFHLIFSILFFPCQWAVCRLHVSVETILRGRSTARCFPVDVLIKMDFHHRQMYYRDRNRIQQTRAMYYTASTTQRNSNGTPVTTCI